MEDVFQYDNYMFDLYGTLIDIRTDEHRDLTWQRWLKVLDENGILHPELDTFRKDFFEADREYRLRPTKFANPEIDILEVYADLFHRYRNEPIDPGKLFEISWEFRKASTIYAGLFVGVPEFLHKLHEKGKKVYILSNAQRSYTLPEIEKFGLDRMVDDYLISSDYKCMKPDPAFYTAMVEKHRLDRSRTVMLGDSKTNDYEGALASGLHAIWLDGENAADRFYKEQVRLAEK